jgi:hypothetical protein
MHFKNEFQTCLTKKVRVDDLIQDFYCVCESLLFDNIGPCLDGVFLLRYLVHEYGVVTIKAEFKPLKKVRAGHVVTHDFSRSNEHS